MATPRPARPRLRPPAPVRGSALRRGPVVASTRPPAREPAGDVPPGPAVDARKTLDEALAVRGRIADEFYRLGELLVLLAVGDVFRALGFRSFEALLRSTQLTGRTTAYKLMAVVKQYPRDVALQMGRARAYALLRLQAEGGAVQPDEDHSVRDLQEAAKKLRDARRGATRSRVPAAGLRRADSLRRWLRRRGLIRARVRAVLVGAALWQRVLLPDAEVEALIAG
ncbi:MAG: hypothetical protein HYY06_15480 [Deltaproteobacteria bacterium]|nr:hypothetical protein [Deltaproteobacteria bacterium]